MLAGSQEFHWPMTRFRMMTLPMFMAWGRVISNRVERCPAPSMWLASYISLGMELKAFIIMIQYMLLVQPGMTSAQGVPTQPRARMTM